MLKAAASDRGDVIRALSEDGRFDPNGCRARVGSFTPLMKAAMAGHADAAAALVADPRTDPMIASRSPTGRGLTALELASRHEHYDVVRILVNCERVAFPERDLMTHTTEAAIRGRDRYLLAVLLGNTRMDPHFSCA
jgi:hypothetical protein